MLCKDDDNVCAEHKMYLYKVMCQNVTNMQNLHERMAESDSFNSVATAERGVTCID
jgi:hypothetical protein